MPLIVTKWNMIFFGEITLIWILIILHLQKILLGMITFYRRQKDMLGEFAFCIKIPSKC